MEILKTILIVGGGILVILMFVLLIYIVVLALRIIKLKKHIKNTIVWFKIANKTYLTSKNLLNKFLKIDGNK